MEYFVVTTNLLSEKNNFKLVLQISFLTVTSTKPGSFYLLALGQGLCQYSLLGRHAFLKADSTHEND